MALPCGKTPITLIWCILECLFFTGILNGWITLQHILTEEGYYFDKCNASLFPSELLEKRYLEHAETADIEEGLDNPFVHIHHGVKWKCFYKKVIKIMTISEYEKYMQSTHPSISTEDHTAVEALSGNATKLSGTELSCNEQQDALEFVMSLIVIIRNILMFPLGVFLDRYGTSRTRLISMCLIALGSLTMLFSSNVHPWLIFPALLMIGVSGMIVLLTDLQVANLFGARRLTVMSILVGSSQSGGLVILFMKLTRETDVTLQTSFMFISIGFVPVLISTIAMLPRSRIPWPLPANYGKSKGMESDPKAWRRRISVGAKRKGDITDILPFIRTKLFLFMVIWLSLLSFKSLAFDLNIDVHLEELGIVETEQYLSMFAMCMLLSLPLSLVIGVLMDYHSNRVQQNHVQQMRNILNAICVNYIISLASSVTSLFPSFGLQTIAYILVAAEKVTLYATLFAFLTHVHFPAEHFGKLVGVAISVSGVMLVFQYPLRILVNSGLSTNMFYTKIILLVLILISGCHPVSVWYHIRTGQIHNQTENNENDKAVNMVMIDKGHCEEQATNMNVVATSGADSDSAKPMCLQITDL